MVVCAGCGRYGAPVAPEMVAPEAVGDLKVVAGAGGVDLAWHAPGKDQRKKELRFIDGYTVMRKHIRERGAETDEDVPFEELGFIPDGHLIEQDALRKEARAQGKVGRRIKVDDEKTKFAYADRSPEKGKVYLYKVVPTNQGGVKGGVKKLAKVYFEGEGSRVAMLSTETGDEEEEAGEDSEDGAGAKSPKFGGFR